VTGNFFSGDQIVGEDRAGSLKFRFDNEKILSDKARQKMILGGEDGDEAVCLTNGERIFRSPTVCGLVRLALKVQSA